MLRAEKASIERSVKEHKRKAALKPSASMNVPYAQNGFLSDFSGIAQK